MKTASTFATPTFTPYRKALRLVISAVMPRSLQANTKQSDVAERSDSMDQQKTPSDAAERETTKPFGGSDMSFPARRLFFGLRDQKGECHPPGHGSSGAMLVACIALCAQLGYACGSSWSDQNSPSE